MSDRVYCWMESRSPNRILVAVLVAMLTCCVFAIAGCGGYGPSAPLAAPSNLGYPQTSIEATVGQAVTADTPSVTGAVSNYTIAPALPLGLGLSASTGTLSGTPTAVAAPASYSVTATNSSGSTTATLNIAVRPAPPSGLVYPQSRIAAIVGQAIAADTPSVIGTVSNYTVAPALPPGLAISATTGTILGTPTTPAPQSSYSVTATNSSGSTTAMLQVAVAAVAGPPLSLVYSQATIVAMVGRSLAPDIPALTGGTVSFSVSPALPAGIAMDTAGAISGTPTEASPDKTYTVTASNSDGSVSTLLTITVNRALPTMLELGHANPIRTLRVSATRVLSQDTANHWVLWDHATNKELLSGDQVVPSFSVTAPIFSWPVDLAGEIFVIGQTNGLDVRAVSDGHLVFAVESTDVDSAAGGTWWKLATDGSYLCNGSKDGLVIWTSTGEKLFTAPGDYSTANVFAAPAEVRIATGPAGQQVIESLSVPAGDSSIGPTFSAAFQSWFLDGQNFLSATGDSTGYLVNTYSSATSVLQSTTSLPTIESLTGQGQWLWTYEYSTPGYFLTIYPLGGGTPIAKYSLGVDTALFPSGGTIGVLPYGTPSASVIDLTGSSPTKTDYSLPIAYGKAYAAASPLQWIVGNVHGVVLDGESASGVPQYFGMGQVFSMAGGTNYLAIATANGTITYYSTGSSGTTPVGSIGVFSSALALSSDGTVLASMANAADSQYESDRTLSLYSLPSGDLSLRIPYEFASGQQDLINFSLSGSGTIVGETVCDYSGAPCTLQTKTVNDGSVQWSASVSSNLDVSDGIKLSPDGSFVAVSLAPYSDTSMTGIYKNGMEVASVPGYAVGWIDDNQLLVNNYKVMQIRGEPPYLVYSSASIYSAAGAPVSTPTLPELYFIQPISPVSIYAPGYNEIFSLPSGAITYSTTVPLTGAATLAGDSVFFVSGPRVLSDTY